MQAGWMQFNTPFIKPSFPSAEELSEDYKKIVDSNWFTNFGPFEKQFSQEIGNYIGDEYTAVTFSSATAGIIASVLGILGKGDGSRYIIMPSFTFVAGADAIVWCGYKPLFVDIETDTLQMDINEARDCIEEKNDEVAAVLLCNAFGVGAPNVSEWEKLVQATDKPLIIDSAAGFGSFYSDDHKVGQAGDCEIFSFHATKPFAIGEGGAVVTKNTKLAKVMTEIQNFGFSANKNAANLGFNGKLQEINAAIGLRQLKVFDEVLENRRRILGRYQTELRDDKYRTQANAERASVCFAAVVVNDAKERDSKLDALHKISVDAKVYYNPPVHQQAYFNDSTCHGSLANTNLICSSILSLPVHGGMSDADIDKIINTLNQ